MENDRLLHKWINGELSEEELKIFKTRPEYDSLKTLYKATEGLAVPQFEEEEMLAQILKEKKSAKRVAIDRKSTRTYPWVAIAMAASVLLLAIWYFGFFGNKLTEYESLRAEKKEALLPDQSSFVLNAESSLSYDPENWNNDRQLNLRGEAFFTVKKGSSFKVNTRNGVVEVLGTEFNVISRRNCLEVRCQSGKVAVKNKNGQLMTELSPNEAIRLKGTEVQEEWIMQNDEASSWIKGLSRFKKVPLSIVLDELERQFDIQIDAQGIDTKEIISCNFDHKDLTLALKTSVEALGISYEMKGEKSIRLYK